MEAFLSVKFYRVCEVFAW